MPLRGAWVLVVEDDEDHRRLAADLLMDLGAQVVVAANGSEGLKRLADRCPELILCDLRMPVMDGLAFAREVRTNSPCRQVCMVALTAVRDPVAYLRTWTAGFDAHLEKPLTAEKLDEIAERLLGG